MLRQVNVVDIATLLPRSLENLSPYNALMARLSGIVVFTGFNILHSSPLLSKNDSCTVEGCSFMKCHVFLFKKKQKNSIYGSISNAAVYCGCSLTFPKFIEIKTLEFGFPALVHVSAHTLKYKYVPTYCFTDCSIRNGRVWGMEFVLVIWKLDT